MKQMLLVTGALLALGGCATGEEAQTTADQESFARELSDRTAGEPRACIQARTSSGITAVDDRTIVRRDGRTLWVNRLAHACPGLRPLTTLIIETHGAEYCRGDRIRALDPGTTIPGPICVIGDWVPYMRSRS
jgi:hypothetical protein